MAQADKTRWNEKYLHNPIPEVPIKLVSTYAKLASGNRALDLACGMGRHSKFLASQGFEVDALDISSLAITSLQGFERIHAQEVDFDTYTLAKEKYDLIVCTYFLERKLFPQMIAALKPKGIILYETFLAHKENQRAPSNPAFMLAEGELEAAFGDSCEIVHVEAFWDDDYKGNKMRKISMVAKKRPQKEAL